MSALTRAAHRWLADGAAPEDGSLSIVDGGIAYARRTGVTHHLADAAEISLGGETTLAAKWLCGASSVDAVLVPEESVDCVQCRLAAVTPQRPCVYFAWGDNKELLYVGSTTNAAQRIRAHVRATEWWPEVRRLTFQECESELEARRAELDAINANPGAYNREGRRPTPPAASVLDLIEGGGSP